MADRALAGRRRIFAGEGDKLHDLFGGKGRRSALARLVAEMLEQQLSQFCISAASGFGAL